MKGLGTKNRPWWPDDLKVKAIKARCVLRSMNQAKFSQSRVFMELGLKELQDFKTAFAALIG